MGFSIGMMIWNEIPKTSILDVTLRFVQWITHDISKHPHLEPPDPAGGWTERPTQRPTQRLWQGNAWPAAIGYWSDMRKVGFLDGPVSAVHRRNAPFLRIPFQLKAWWTTEKILAAFADRQLRKLHDFQGSEGYLFWGGWRFGGRAVCFLFQYRLVPYCYVVHHCIIHKKNLTIPTKSS